MRAETLGTTDILQAWRTANPDRDRTATKGAGRQED